MVKLPTREDLGALPSLPSRGASAVARFDTTAIGRGAAHLGKAIQQAAVALDKMDGQERTFDTERRYQEFQWEQQKALDQSMREVKPGEAKGFADNWAETYKESAKRFFSTVPNELKPQYDLKLLGTERRYYGTAASFARGEQKRHSLEQLDDTSNSYYSRASAGEPYDGIRSDYTALLDANPYLTPIEKDAELRKGLAKLEETHIRSRIQRGEDLDVILQDIRGHRLEKTQGTQTDTQAKRLDDHAAITVRLETGTNDPLTGVANISGDAGGTKSYGNFGLNSQPGGSIFTFVKEHGKEFGLTAKPGTQAFDAQWRHAATVAPKDLHEAEMAWYDENITSGIGGKLTEAGVPKAVAADARVRAYFADRLIQQGPASVAKHRKRIRTALEEAKNDPVRFLQAMTELDRRALENDFPTALATGVYSAKGHDNRLDGRLNMALGLPEKQAAGPAYTGPYAHLPPGRRLALERLAKTNARTVNLQDLKNGEEEIRRTGTASLDANGEDALERARRHLTGQPLARAETGWIRARLEYNALHDLDMLPEQELQARLGTIEPQSGDKFYQIKAEVYDKAVKRAETIRRLREKDPAASVDNFPKVMVAAQGVKENPEDPDFMQTLVQARMDAQAEAGIPEIQRSPITRDEARVFLAPIRGLEGRPLMDALKGVEANLREKYGPYARAAAEDLFAFDSRSKETAQELTAIMNRAFQDQRPTAAQQRRLEILQEADQADRALGRDFIGDPFRQYYGRPEGPPQGTALQVNPANYYRWRTPPRAAVEALRANPGLKGEFDAYYGTGSAERAMKE